MPYIFLVTFFIMTSSAFAEYSPSYYKNIFLTAGAFNEKNGTRSGLEASTLINTSDHVAMRLSGVLYADEYEDNLVKTFSGYTVSGYLHLGLKYINPYVGLGIFSGDTFKCSDEEKKEELCEEDTVFSIYPEVGLAINLGRLHIFPHVRHYNFNNKNTYGLNLGLSY